MMGSVKAICLSVLASVAFATTAFAQTVVSSTTTAITVSGSYIFSGTHSGTFTISASNVYLNLNGYRVAIGSSCSISGGGSGPGNSCTSGYVSSQPGISITGTNVTIENGGVTGNAGDGILVTPLAGSDVNLVLRNMTLSQNKGAGLNLGGGSGATLIDVQASQNGHDGFFAGSGDRITVKNLTANFNNGDGINAPGGLGNFTDITASKNAQWGVLANGNLTRVVATGNTGVGISTLGVVRDATVSFNGGDGLDNLNNRGLVIDSSASFNGGIGFNLSNSVCYSRLSSTANTGVQISGGVALAGSVASCQ